jgi:16S rRNA G966 N2-methylase RsmD
MPENVLYYGDNLEILRRYIEDESADLVHLDPPFVWRKEYAMPLLTQNRLFYGKMKAATMVW